MMISETAIALTVVSSLGAVVSSILGYFLKNAMTELKEVQIQANKTDSALAVLTKDHDNKNEFMNEKIDMLNTSIVSLTSEIKQLNSKMRD